MITLYRKKAECCGCTACKSICPKLAIVMKEDEEGFLYPNINRNLCIECGLCINVCPLINEDEPSCNFGIPEVYALKHKSDEVRLKSSSGGAFTAISDYVLSMGGMIYGATFDEKLNVFHQGVETAGGRDKFRGSKYVQSDLKEVLIQINQELIKGRNVLFTGTGCQVAGLERYLKQLKVNTKNLLTVDIICHGTPSPRIFKDYISYLEEKNSSKISHYLFRSKINGWGHTEVAIFKSGKHDHSSILSQSYKELFYSNLCLRPACYQCKYACFSRSSDITIADYWGIENHIPRFADSLGISAVIINTKKGSDVFSKIARDIETMPSNIYDCAERQVNLYKPTHFNPQRDKFWNDYLQNNFDYVIKKYTKYGIKNRIKGMLKNSLVYILTKVKIIEAARKILRKVLGYV